jgi:hypothetical protein
MKVHLLCALRTAVPRSHSVSVTKGYEKMPWAKNDKIVIQSHDGAPGHNGKGNAALLAQAGAAGGWNIVFGTQPASASKLQCLAPCFFNSLQSMHAGPTLRPNCLTRSCRHGMHMTWTLWNGSGAIFLHATVKY